MGGNPFWRASKINIRTSGPFQYFSLRYVFELSEIEFVSYADDNTRYVEGDNRAYSIQLLHAIVACKKVSLIKNIPKYKHFSQILLKFSSFLPFFLKNVPFLLKIAPMPAFSRICLVIVFAVMHALFAVLSVLYIYSFWAVARSFVIPF